MQGSVDICTPLACRPHRFWLWDYSPFIDTNVPYDGFGRKRQKSRTRTALVQAAQHLLAQGVDLTVERVAEAADISRTTAYRYFRNAGELVRAAYPQITDTSLLPSPAPTDPLQRLDLVMRAFIERVTLAWEPQLRASLRLALESAPTGSPLRQGRAIGWIEDALAPLRRSHRHLDVRALAIAIRAGTGIESLVWLVDVAGQSHAEAAQTMHANALALARDAMAMTPAQLRRTRPDLVKVRS